MTVTPITPAQIDEVGKGEPPAGPGYPAETTPASSRGAARGYSSREATNIADELARLSRAAPFPIEMRHDCLAVHVESHRIKLGLLGREMAEFVFALVNAYRAGELVPAFAAANPSGGWRPIETAPKTGQWFEAWFTKIVPDDDADFAVAGVDTIRWSGKGFWWSRHVGTSYPAARPSFWRPLSEPGALAGEAAQAAETEGLGLRASDGEAGTPSLPPSPRKGQEENPCPMTVEEARSIRSLLDDALALLEVDDEANTPGTDTYTFIVTTKDALRRKDAAGAISEEAISAKAKAMCSAHCDRAEGQGGCPECAADQEHDWRADAELALSTIRASEEDR